MKRIDLSAGDHVAVRVSGNVREAWVVDTGTFEERYTIGKGYEIRRREHGQGVCVATVAPWSRGTGAVWWEPRVVNLNQVTCTWEQYLEAEQRSSDLARERRMRERAEAEALEQRLDAAAAVIAPHAPGLVIGARELKLGPDAAEALARVLERL